jgi:DNA-binding CsgD family transcriptional regulator
MEEINMNKLTKREQEILCYVCKGYSNNEISKALWISPHTAKAHVKHILEKFAAKNRTQLAYFAGVSNFKTSHKIKTD